MKKDLKILREAYVYDNHIKLCYMIEYGKVRQDFTTLSRDVFPSLSKEEIKNCFEKLNDIGTVDEHWTGIEISVKMKKDKEEIKAQHQKIMRTLKEIFEELGKKEKERNLSSWLWRKKTFKLN